LNTLGFPGGAKEKDRRKVDEIRKSHLKLKLLNLCAVLSAAHLRGNKPEAYDRLITNAVDDFVDSIAEYIAYE
jgi:hypothetical protein